MPWPLTPVLPCAPGSSVYAGKDLDAWRLTRHHAPRPVSSLQGLSRIFPSEPSSLQALDCVWFLSWSSDWTTLEYSVLSVLPSLSEVYLLGIQDFSSQPEWIVSSWALLSGRSEIANGFHFMSHHIGRRHRVLQEELRACECHLEFSFCTFEFFVVHVFIRTFSCKYILTLNKFPPLSHPSFAFVMEKVHFIGRFHLDFQFWYILI